VAGQEKAQDREAGLSSSDLILRSRDSGVSKEDPVVSGDALSFETLRSSA
jgi:hypothetical protein